MGTTNVIGPAAREAVVPRAVVWIDGRQAVVAAMGTDGRISTFKVSRGWLSLSSYLAQVVQIIGDRERVGILGPDPARLALEREYVAIFRRPDRLVDVEPSDPVSSEALVDRLRAFAA